jgi:lysophospholipase L1-like esterase
MIGRACCLALVLAGALLTAPAHAAPQRYYLALGDSDAFGFQFPKYTPGVPASAFSTGYADHVAAALPGRRLVNYACPGESTTSFITGPSPYRANGQQLHDDYVGSQLATALAFLLTHPGRTDLITVTLWGNDINAFLATCHNDLACVQAGLQPAIARYSARLALILAPLKLAAGPHAKLVLTGVYDPNPQPFAQITHPLFLALDHALKTVAGAIGVRFAPLFATFDGDTALCTLTLLCSDGDAHPSDAGYQAIADRVLAASS